MPERAAGNGDDFQQATGRFGQPLDARPQELVEDARPAGRVLARCASRTSSCTKNGLPRDSRNRSSALLCTRRVLSQQLQGELLRFRHAQRANIQLGVVGCRECAFRLAESLQERAG